MIKGLTSRTHTTPPCLVCLPSQTARLPQGGPQACLAHPRSWPDKQSALSKYLLDELIFEEKT